MSVVCVFGLCFEIVVCVVCVVYLCVVCVVCVVCLCGVCTECVWHGVVFVFAWHVHGVCVLCVDGVVCSGEANDERNREHVVLNPLLKL